MKNAIVLCIVFMSSTFLFGQKEKTIIRTKTKIGTHKRAPLEIESYYPGNDTVYYYSRSKVVGNDTILLDERLNGYQNPYIYPLVVKNNDSTKNNFLYYNFKTCLLYTSPSPRDQRGSRMPSSA